MVRITLISDTETSLALRVEGRVVADWIAVLEREAQACLRTGKSVELNFAGVNYIDDAGVRMLTSLGCDRLRIVHASAFIRTLLESGCAR